LVRRASKKDTARTLAVAAARSAHDNNAEDIIILDLRGVSPVTDYFVVCSGSSDRQMRTVGDEIIKYGESMGQKVWGVEGMDTGGWIVLDFVDVVVHIFDLARRRYYDLELIWGAAPRVRWRRRTPSPKRRQTKE
jgi:ribosome-associated protein